MTSAWTDAHVGLVAGAGMLALLGTLSTTGPSASTRVAVPTLVVALATFVLASLTDAFGGMVIGLVAAAGFTAVHQYVPEAHPVTFATQALTLGLLFLLGMTSGLVADRVRRGRRIAARSGGESLAPVEGSMGLMTAADAAFTLEEERVRAQLHQRPFTTAVIDVEITDSSLEAEDVRRLRRAVARSLETELRVTDIVFIDELDRFGAALPETDEAAAVDIIESALMVARAATFADRGVGYRRPVDEVAKLHVELTAVVCRPARPAKKAVSQRKQSAAPVRKRATRAKAESASAPVTTGQNTTSRMSTELAEVH